MVDSARHGIAHIPEIKEALEDALKIEEDVNKSLVPADIKLLYFSVEAEAEEEAYDSD